MASPDAAIITSQIQPAILAAERVRVMPPSHARWTLLPGDVLLSRGVREFNRDDIGRDGDDAAQGDLLRQAQGAPVAQAGD